MRLTPISITKNIDYFIKNLNIPKDTQNRYFYYIYFF